MINTKPWCGGSDEEYETQHFGFGSQRLKIAMRNMVERKITDGVKGMEEYLQGNLALNDTDKVTLTRSCDKLIRLYCERAEPSLQIIDDEIERVLKIPSNTLLPEDECQFDQISDAEYSQLKEEVAALRKRVERSALMEALLTAEEKELSSAEKICETAKRDMDVLDLVFKNTDNNETMKSVQYETQILCASVPFLKKQKCDVFDD